jgi:hypothetical protein
VEWYRPGETLYGQFVVSNAFGAAAPADATPIGSAYRNNVVDPAVPVAIAAIPGAGGAYGFSATIPGAYAGGDVLSILGLATIAGTPGRAELFRTRLLPPSGLPADVQAWRSGTPNVLQGGNVPTPAAAGTVTVGGYVAGQDPATLVLDVAKAAHNLPNTIGEAINTGGTGSGGGGAGTASNYYTTVGLDFDVDGEPDGEALTLFVGNRRTLLVRLRDANGDPVAYGQGTVSARLTSGTVPLGGDVSASAPYGRTAPYAQFDLTSIQTATAGLRSLTVTQTDGGTEQTFGPRPVTVKNR